ncbi:MAG: hypothetical protein R3E48_18210, partial [Burkholderiaceae bacterium]
WHRTMDDGLLGPTPTNTMHRIDYEFAIARSGGFVPRSLKIRIGQAGGRASKPLVPPSSAALLMGPSRVPAPEIARRLTRAAIQSGKWEDAAAALVGEIIVVAERLHH